VGLRFIVYVIRLINHFLPTSFSKIKFYEMTDGLEACLLY
jgi:hypothetical protein